MAFIFEEDAMPRSLDSFNIEHFGSIELLGANHEQLALLILPEIGDRVAARLHCGDGIHGVRKNQSQEKADEPSPTQEILQPSEPSL